MPGSDRGVTSDYPADQRLETIRQAIVDYRDDFSARSLIKGGILSAVAVAVLLVILTIIARLRRRLEGSLREKLSGRTLFKVLTGDGLVSVVTTVDRLVHFGTATWLVLVTLNFALTLFPWTCGVTSQVFEMAVGPMKTFGTAFAREIPR